jgi:NAD(P)H-hydrate epimerase
VDELLGTGARGEPEAMIAAGVEVLRVLDERGTRVVAVDLPTGVDADHGEIARRAVRADLTVTFGAAKRGHWLYPGRAFAGAVEVLDIGLDPATSAIETSSEAVMAALVPRRDPRVHKGAAGRLVVIGGSPGLTGAVTLAAKAATRSGAGYVTVCVPQSFESVFAVKLVEEISIGMPETPHRALSTEAFGLIMSRVREARAVAVGSGMSTDPSTADLCRRLVSEAPWPMVIDADALTAFSGRGEMLGRAPEPRIVTPHLGEMARLTGLTTPELDRDRIDVAVTYAARWNVVVVLKGAPTVTAHPDGRATVNTSGNPGLATAGTGDVLTGVIAALLAQGLAAYDAARLGAYVHGRAGDLAVAERGELGLAASDLLDRVPRTLDALARARGR